MPNYGEAFKRPFQDFKKLGIGIILAILPIINFFVAGYQLVCAKTAMKKDYALPPWKSFWDLFVKGLVSFLISLIYLIPAIICIIIALILGGSILVDWFSQLWIPSEKVIQLSLVSLGNVFLILLLAMLFIIFVAYLIPIALLQYIEKGKFSDAFELKKVFRKAFQGKYFAAWFVVTLYAIFLTAILSYIPFIGKAIATFITGVTVFTAIGEIYPSLK